MAEQVIKALVEGGKATPAPPLGPSLGTAGLNIGQVISQINEKTKKFAGMKVPIKIYYDPADKSKIRVEVGIPPVSQLIKKELGLKKAASTHEEPVGDIKMDLLVKLTKTKQPSMQSTQLKQSVKEVVGTCISMGVTVEGKSGKIIQKEIDEGKWDEIIK